MADYSPECTCDLCREITRYRAQLAAQEREMIESHKAVEAAGAAVNGLARKNVALKQEIERLRERLGMAEELCKFIGEDRLPCERSGNIDCDCAPCQVTRLAQAFLAPASPGPEMVSVQKEDLKIDVLTVQEMLNDRIIYYSEEDHLSHDRLKAALGEKP